MHKILPSGFYKVTPAPLEILNPPTALLGSCEVGVFVAKYSKREMTLKCRGGEN